MYLEKIDSPADLKKVARKDLQAVADEVRTAVLNRVSKHGGHIGPNLGFVEATVALHYVFDAPKDKFVFDVSHQCYPHKVLTGRAYGFVDDSRFDEISGYSSPSESPDYDMFEIGHTSTSVALATGLQKARDLRGGDENIVAIIGDGSLSGGEAFEGLDMAAEIGTGIIVVVNDNEMSIAENHGGLYGNLRLLRETGGKAECNFFRAMGLEYTYVEQGNDIESLIEAFSSVKGTRKPTVVHIHTEKGHGYKPAVENKEAFHAGGPFDLSTGKRQGEGGENYGGLLGDLLRREAEKDPLLFIVTSATPTIVGNTLSKRLAMGAQHVDVGIAEEEAVALVSGAAKGGAHPVWNVFSTFVQRVYDQVAQDLCINGNPAVLNVHWPGVYGMNDITHIGFFDIPMLSNIPGLVYLAPTCYEELETMELWAIAQDKMPVAIRVPGGPVVRRGKEFAKDYSDLNKYLVEREGADVALIGVGNFFGLAEAVAAELEKTKGLRATLVNPRYLTGLDTELLDTLKSSHRLVVTLEDGSVEGGFGEKIARHYGDSDVKTLVYGIAKGLYDRYDVGKMLTDNRLTAPQIVEDVCRVLD